MAKKPKKVKKPSKKVQTSDTINPDPPPPKKP
jgi:hypothetical protein